MSENQQYFYRDEFNRTILDVTPPLESFANKLIGFVFWFMLALGIVCSFKLMSDIWNLAVLEVLFLFEPWKLVVTAVFFMLAFIFRKMEFDCYFVLDTRGGRLLYHYTSAIIESEELVTSFDNIEKISVAQVAGGNVLVIHADFKAIKVSDPVGDNIDPYAKHLAQIVNKPFDTKNSTLSEHGSSCIEQGLSRKKLLFIGIPLLLYVIAAPLPLTTNIVRSRFGNYVAAYEQHQKYLERMNHGFLRRSQYQLEQLFPAYRFEPKKKIRPGVGIERTATIGQPLEKAIAAIGLEPDANSDGPVKSFMAGALLLKTADNIIEEIVVQRGIFPLDMETEEKLTPGRMGANLYNFMRRVEKDFNYDSDEDNLKETMVFTYAEKGIDYEFSFGSLERIRLYKPQS